MKTDANFLNSRELAEYNKNNRYFFRSGATMMSTGEILALKSTIETQVQQICHDHIRNKSKALKLLTIDITESDGTSWLMQRIFETSKRNFGTFHFFNFTSVSQDHHTSPAIAQVIGYRNFFKIAAKNRLVEGFIRMFPLSNYLMILLSAVLSVIANFLFPLFATSNTVSIQNILTFENGVLFFVVSGVLVCSKVFSEQILFRSTSNVFQNLIEKLNKIEISIQGVAAKSHSNKDVGTLYDKFIDDLINHVNSRDYPRFFIVDNYARLDFTTRRFIEKYFQKFISEDISISGKEVWIIAEPKIGNEKLSTSLLIDYQNVIDKFIQQLIVNNLSLADKKKLLQEINGDPAWEKFSEVQFVCNGKGKSHDWIYQKSISVREQQLNQKYSHLDLAFLISLTTYFDQTFFKIDDIKKFLNKDFDSDLTTLLNNVFVDASLSKTEIGYHLENMLSDFKELIMFDQHNGISLKNDFAFTLFEYRKELGLTEPENGHLYWVYFWGQILEGKTFEIGSIKKFTYHLINAGFKDIPVNNYDHFVRKLIEYYFYAIRGCIYTGHFEFIIELLYKAKDLILTQSENFEQLQSELLHICWKCYSILKDNSIVDIFIELSTNLQSNENTDVDVLTEFFVELIPIPYLSDSIKHENFGKWILSQKNDLSLEYYIKSQSIWISLSAHFATKDLDMILLSKSGFEAYRRQNELSSSLLEREWKSQDLVITLVSLSTFSWSKGLLFQNELNGLRSTNLSSFYDDFSKLLDHSVKSIDFLDKMKIISSNQLDDFGPFIKALAGEVMISILSSIYIAYISILNNPYKIEFEDNNDFQKRIVSCIHRISRVLNLGLDEITEIEHLESAYFRDRIIESFNFYSLIWRKLNMKELHSNLSLKRIQFFTLTQRNRTVESIDFSLISSIYEFLNTRNQTGLLSNLIISRYLERLTQHSSHFFNNAGNLAIEGEFGIKIIKELSAIILIYFNRVNSDLSNFADKVTESEESSEAYIQQLLGQVPEKKLFNILLQLSNASSRIGNKKLQKNYKKTVRHYSTKISNPSIKRKTEALFEYIDLTENVFNTDGIDPSKIMKDWADRKDLYLYAAVLQSLLLREEVGDKIKIEVLNVLEHPLDSSYDSYLHLAIVYSERYLLDSQDITQKEEAIVIGYLLNNYHRFEDIENAETNTRLFRILNFHYYPQFQSKLEFWEQALADIIHKEQIPMLLKKGHYFILFRKYVEDMWYWGLNVNISRNSYKKLIQIEEKRKPDELDKWLISHSRIPAPIFNKSNISSDYLVIGSYLFSHSTIENTKYETLRNDFNEIGKQSLLMLIDLILELEKVPLFYKNILSDFYSKFEKSVT